MTTNWEDQFDLEPENKPKSKINKNKKFANQFVDFDDTDDIKLPSINNKNPTHQAVNKAKATENINLEEIKQKSKQKIDPEEQLEFEEELVESVPVNKSTIKGSRKEIQLQQPMNSSGNKQEEEEEYGQQNFEAEENYDEDFEAEEKKPMPIVGVPPKGEKKPISKPTTISKPSAKGQRAAVSVAKKKEVTSRDYSRNSARSNERSAHSKTRNSQQKQEPHIPNKYSSFAQKHSPNYTPENLEQFSLDKLTRQNQRIRSTIKKLNDELNDLINKNILQLKGKKTEKEVNQDDLVKQLEQLKLSNQTALQNTIRELNGLKGKEENLVEGEGHLSLDQKISEAKNKIVEEGKIITKYKFQIDNQGKKLTKIQKKDKENPTVEMGNIKLATINIQKQFEKNQQQITKMQSKAEDLTKKLAEVDQKISGQFAQAKYKGISVITNPQLFKKAQQLKKKIDNARQHKSKTEALYKTKCQLIEHQNDQIRSQIKQIENATLHSHANCEDMQIQSKKTVQKATKGGKISQDMISVLENIISEMERGVMRDTPDERGTFAYPKGARKYQSLKNVEKVTSTTAPLKQVDKSQDDTNLKKPVLFKKKKGEEQIPIKTQRQQRQQKQQKQQRQQKQQQRVWKQQKSPSPKQPEKPKQSAAQLAKFQDKQEKKEDDKKKPFMIKKNRNHSTQQLKESPKAEIKKTIQQPVEKQQAPTVAPRMMRFNRKNKEDTIEETKPSEPKLVVPPPKLEQPKQEEDKPAFVPKRFNLKLKDRKNSDSGYTASITEKKEQAKVEESKPIVEQKPKGLALNSDPYSKPLEKNIEQQKPRFNLKLKDRQKQNNQQPKLQPEAPKEQVEQPTAKINISLSDQPKQNSNPYAQSYQNRRRDRNKEGPIKEQKAITNAPKPKYDLFSQAEDLSNVQQLKGNEPTAVPKYVAPKQQDLDLNQLLGKKTTKKAQIDEDLLLDDNMFGRGKK